MRKNTEHPQEYASEGDKSTRKIPISWLV